MNVILSIGILIFTGYVFGELANKVKLPKISGYIVAGILLNPDLLGIMSPQFVEHTDPLLTVALSVITFSIGGSLSWTKLKATGRKILVLTFYESLAAFFAVFVLMFLSIRFFLPIFNSLNVIIAVSLVLASLAAPTDPSATIAVIHEYKAKGVVSSAMLEIAAFDDIVGIVIYTLATVSATSFLGSTSADFVQILGELGRNIGGALLVGFAIGVVFNQVVKIFKGNSDGTLIVLTFGLILLSYGVSEYFGFESLLSSMALGAIVINKNKLAEQIFKLIERYTDELIFVIFFSLSGLHIQLSALGGSVALILIYILSRGAGKFSGIFLGSLQVNAHQKIKKYAAGGLIPQGGIVIGLALLLTNKPVFKESASIIIGIVIGAALIHEILGPVLSRFSLSKAGEIKSSVNKDGS